LRVNHDNTHISEYEIARPDVLAQEVPLILQRINVDKQVKKSLHIKTIFKLLMTWKKKTINQTGRTIFTL
jgi:hypothetical protein